jgi:hypothetical protein
MNDDLSDAADRGREKQGPRGLSDELGSSGDTSDSNAPDSSTSDGGVSDSSSGDGGRADGKEPTTRFTADLPDSLHREFKIAAVEEDRSMKDLVITVLEKYLNQRST